MKRANAQLRQERREQLAQEKTQKKADRDDAITQRLASLQILNEQRAIAKSQKKKSLKRQDKDSSRDEDIQVVERPVVMVPQMLTSRSGRQLRKPQHLDDCLL